MSETQHTPTPWFAVNDGTAKEPMWSVKAARIAGQKPRHEVAICATGDSPQEMETANAAFIVAAVNSHATLTTALEEARGALEVFAEAHKAYDAYSLCVRVDEFGAPTMRKLQSQTDNDASVVLGSYPISESTSTTVHIRVADFRRARTALATINAALGRKE